MFNIELVERRKLLKNKEVYAPLILRGAEELIEPIDLLAADAHDFVSIAAFFHKKPIGLAIAEIIPGFDIMDVKSLFVIEEYKKHHLQLKMVQHLERLFAKQGGKMIHALYADAPPFLEEWEKTFIEAHWNGRRLAIIECFYDDSHKFHPKWFDKPYTLPPNFELFYWKDLTPEDKTEIERAYSQKIIPPEVYPFAGGGVFEPLNSLGIRYKGRVIGWIITRRLDDQTICYYSLYCEQEFRKKGPGMLLVTEAVRLQQKAMIKQALFRVNVLLLPSLDWFSLIKRRLVPYARRYTEFYLAWHDLTNKQ
jgi:GNAT superfamily N-acetyltransferase